MKTLICSYMPRLMDPAQILAELTAPTVKVNTVEETVTKPRKVLKFETFALAEIVAYISLITKSPATVLDDIKTLDAEAITVAMRTLKKTSAAARDDALDKQDAFWNVRDELDKRGYTYPDLPAHFGQEVYVETREKTRPGPSAWDKAFPGAQPPTIDEILAATGDDNA